MAKKAHHVIPRPSSGWSIKKSGASRASKTFTKKEDAVKYARKLARSSHSELIVHKRNGRIQSKDSYGKDPNPPKDKR